MNLYVKNIIRELSKNPVIHCTNNFRIYWIANIIISEPYFSMI
jgi:hypothetical protein